MSRLEGNVDHLFHLAAIYDMTADAESQRLANVEGTRHMVEFAEAVEAGHVHMVSSIAAAGLYKGTWREDMFEEAENLDSHPYFRTKHDSEGIVRYECSRPWRVYRPGIVVGHSETGEMDKIDGPYYFFKLIRRLRNAVPQWVPMIGVQGREINLVPVDFVARAMDHIAHQEGLDGRAFHLTDPNPKTAGEVIDIFAACGARAAGLGAGARGRASMRSGAAAQARSRLPRRSTSSPISVLADLGSPRSVLTYVNYPTSFDCSRGAGGARRHRHQGAAARGLRRQAVGLLGAPPGSGPVPRPHAGRSGQGQSRAVGGVTQIIEQQIPDELLRLVRRVLGTVSLEQAVRGRVVMVTGASSGIGRSAALKIADAGGIVLLVARTAEKLEETRAQIENGGRHRSRASRAICRTWTTSTGWRTRCSPSTATWTSSSTTRGARSAARSPSPTTASTTSSARCSSTTSGR